MATPNRFFKWFSNNTNTKSESRPFGWRRTSKKRRSTPGHDHWVAAKKVMRYLKRTKDYMLIYKHVQDLHLVGYLDSDFADCQDEKEVNNRLHL